MLSEQDNELMCRVGPGTPMGEVMRQYWLPVFFPDEFEADGPPLRTRLLCEDLCYLCGKNWAYISSQLLSALLTISAQPTRGNFPRTYG